MDRPPIFRNIDPPNLQCSQVGSLTQRRLCQTLNLPFDVPLETPRPFTGLPDTDILLLYQMSDQDLINVCAVNKYVNNLCNHPSFWLNRILSRYGDQLGSGQEIRNKYIPPGTSWKDYYLWLSGLLEGPRGMAYFIAVENDREDLMILLSIEPSKVGVGLGFKTPQYISANLIGFLTEANFGSSDPTNLYSLPLNTYISAISTGISNRSVLTVLFRIYIKVNDTVNTDPNAKRSSKATPLMHKWLGETFKKLSEAPQRYKQGVPIPKFDPNKMSMSYIQKIFIVNTINRDQLTPEQLAVLTDPEISKRLKNEVKLYSSIHKYLRNK